MAIRFDPDYNAEIRRIVNNFNQKRRRAIKRGIAAKYLPEKQYVSELKLSYPTKSALNRELRQLQEFNRMGMSAFEVVTTAAGGKISEYNLNYIKKNLQGAKQFYDQQIKEAEEIIKSGTYKNELTDTLLTLKANRQKLDYEIDTLNDYGLQTLTTLVRKPAQYNKMKITGYRGFLSLVETSMKYLGYDKKVIDTFFEKMSNLSPNQFTVLYNKSNLISRIYDLIPSPPIKGRVFNTDDVDAKNLIDVLLETFDEMVDEITK